MEIESSQPELSSPLQFCFIEKELEHHRELIDSIQLFKASYFHLCEAALHAASRKRNDKRIIFVSKEFEGHPFRNAKKVSKSILGPPAVIAFAHIGDIPEIPPINRPLYNLVLKGAILVVDGFSETVTAKLIKTVQSLGGSVLKRLSESSIARHHPSHLIAHSGLCKSYQIALQNRMNVVREEWLKELWSRRDEKGLIISLDVTPRHQLEGPNFLRNVRVHLLGFSQSELKQWSIAVISAGGVVDEEISSSTNVIVLNESCSSSSLQLMRDNLNIRTYRFTCENGELLFDIEPSQTVVDTGFLKSSFLHKVCAPVADFEALRDAGVLYRHGRRKRRLSLESAFEPEVFSSPKRRLLPESHPVMPRRFGKSPAAKAKPLSRRSPSPKKPVPADIPARVQQVVESPKECQPLASERWYRVMELLNTERNYVRILTSLWDNLIAPLRDRCGDENALLEFPQIHSIFRNLFDICKLHHTIIQDLEKATCNWEETCQIGTVWVKHAPAFIELYSLYINSFESSKMVLEQCGHEKADFRNFVKGVMDLPEFGRCSLSDILIRPVQRLPSVLLLLRELSKRTEENHPDFRGLQLAVLEMERVLQQLNESKRISEVDGPSGSGHESRGLNGASQVSLKPRKSTGTNQAWEKARKLSSKTTNRLSKVFSFGTRTSGLKRAASQAVLIPAKNAKNNLVSENM